jgi:hypothetical protein
MRIGGQHPHAKLTETQIPVIDGLAASGLKYHEIAPLFHVAAQTVQGVLHRQNWAHVPREVHPVLLDACRLITTFYKQRDIEMLKEFHARLSMAISRQGGAHA